MSSEITLRDTFAAAAVPGMIVYSKDNAELCEDQVAQWCYEIADAMLRRRDEPNHDAAPAATATAAGMMGCKPDSPGTGGKRDPIRSWEQDDQILRYQQAEINRMRDALSSIRSRCWTLNSAVAIAIVCTCDHGLGDSSRKGER
jgi:hypothetical protein